MKERSNTPTSYIRPSATVLNAKEASLVDALGEATVFEKVEQALKSGGVFSGNDAVLRIRAQELVNAGQAYIKDRNGIAWEGLVQCPLSTIVSSITQLAMFDLEANAITGTGFLVPYGLKQNKPVCSACPGVRGMERTMMRSGLVKTIQAWHVCAQDKYEFQQGGDEDPRLTRCLHPDPSKPNPIVAAFCRIVLKDGAKHIVEVPIDAANLQAGRSTPEKAAQYIAQRAAQRDVVRTYLFDKDRTRQLSAMVELEDQMYRNSGEDHAAVGRVSAAPTAAVADVSVPEIPIEASTPTPAPILAPVDLAPGPELNPSDPVITDTLAVDPIARSVANARAEVASSSPVAPSRSTTPPRTFAGRRI